MLNLAEYRKKPKMLTDFLPWAALVAPGVILNKDGSFQRTARFRGPDLDSATPAELVGTTARLNNALRRLGSGWAIFVEASRIAAQRYPQSRFPDPASNLVDAERRAQFEEAGAHFESAYYLTLLWLPPSEEASRAERWLYEGRSHKTGVEAHELLNGFIDRTDRVLQLVEGFVPEAEWLNDEATLTYLRFLGGGLVEANELEVDGVVAGHQAVPRLREGRCVWRRSMPDGDDDALVEAGAGQVVQQAQAGVVRIVDVVDDQEHAVGGGSEAEQLGGGDEQSLVSGLARPSAVGAGERPVDLVAVRVGQTVEERRVAAAQVRERLDDRRIWPRSFDDCRCPVAGTPAAPHRRGP